MLRVALLMLSIVASVVPPAVAATIQAAKGMDGRVEIRISGELLRGDDERFATVAGSAPDEVTVFLEGPGGNLVTGLRIGSAIRMRAWKTAVSDGAVCASACGLVWLGGAQRAVGRQARIGFHAAWIEGPDGSKREVGSGNALVGSYLGRLGLTDAAVVYLTSAPPGDAAWLTEATAKLVGIRAEFGASEPPRQAAVGPRPMRMPVSSPPSSGVITGANTGTQMALLEELYANYPWTVRLPTAETCVGRPCKVRLLADQTWTGSDGTEHLILVGAAEVKDDCHACLAILGIGQFRRSSPSDLWQKEVLAPAVDRIGGYGVFGGKVSFVDAGSLGRIIMLEDSGGGMGEFGSVARLFAAVGGKFKEVLLVPLSLSVDGTCELKESECRKRIAQSNYESKLAISVGEDQKLHVDQTFTAAIAIPPASWIIDDTGTSKQTAGGKVGPGSNAEERATLPSPLYDQGRADRVAYEAWFSGLQGDIRAGAESWAGRRSLRSPGNCEAAAGQSPLWSTGCSMARQKLAPLDGRRKAEPDYRRGWNSV